jgi:hypothetical protein
MDEFQWLFDIRIFAWKWFPLNLGTMAILGIVFSWWSARAWKQERDRVRGSILGELHLSKDDKGYAAARAQLLALVPCTGQALQAPLDRLEGFTHLWLCVLSGRLLMVAGVNGQAAALATEELRAVYLTEVRPAKRGWFLRAFGSWLSAIGISPSEDAWSHCLILDTERGRSSIAINRLDDLFRVVNSLVHLSIPLRYMATES